MNNDWGILIYIRYYASVYMLMLPRAEIQFFL